MGQRSQGSEADRDRVKEKQAEAEGTPIKYRPRWADTAKRNLFKRRNENMNAKDNHKANVFSEDFNSDKETVCSRRKSSIPPLLAQVVPAEMRISVLGPGPDGRPIYMVTRELICGTAEDIIEYLMENLLLSDPEVEAYISKAGVGIEGPLYAVTQFVLGGSAGSIIEYFGC